MARPRAPRGSAKESLPVRVTPKKRSPSPDVTWARLSKRPSRNTSAKSTPQKSIYREVDSDEFDSDNEVANEESGYEDEDASAVPEDESDDDEEFDESEDEKPKKKGHSKVNVKTNGKMNGSSKKSASKDLWREGVKVDGEGEVFIALPRARSPGGIPYRDDTLHPNTFLFLGDLKKNNDREWLKLHDKDFRQSEKDWKSFVEALTERLIEKDETIPELPFKDVVFRIYRDVRFSSDPTPYKPHFSAAFSRTGRKGPYAAYYVQIAPGKTFIGGGLWCPDAAPLSDLRRAVDQRSSALKRVLLEPGIRKHYLGGIGKDEKKAVKAFCGHNADNALKRHPKGYDEGHPEIDLLRLKNFTMGKKLKDEEVLGPKGLNNIVDMLATLTPFITYLNSVVMPDQEADGSNQDDDDDSDPGPDDDRSDTEEPS